MPLYHMTDTELAELPRTGFAESGIREREDLQRLLRGSIEAVAPDTMVLTEAFSGWETSRRELDLLGLDRQANLVVVELKRTDDGGHAELQALRYAAMVAPMTFQQAVQAHAEHLAGLGQDPKQAEARILEFLGWAEPDEDAFAADVRIVLAAAGFSPELTTTALWLSERGLDIRCVRLVPHRFGGELVLSVEPCLPPPGAEDYRVRLRDKHDQQRRARREQRAWTGYWFVNVGEGVSRHRCWEDCRAHGFLIAGSGPRWIGAIQRLQVGDRVLAYVSGAGYVGLGEVTAAAVPQKDFVTAGGERLIDLPLATPPDPAVLDDPERCDWCVGVEWLATLDRDQALRYPPNRQAVAKLHDPALVEQLLEQFDAPGGTGR